MTEYRISGNWTLLRLLEVALGIPRSEMVARGKTRQTVIARRLAVCVLRISGESWPRIGAAFDQPHYWALRADRSWRQYFAAGNRDYVKAASKVLQLLKTSFEVTGDSAEADFHDGLLRSFRELNEKF